MKLLYIVKTRDFGSDGMYALIDVENKTILASHICSSDDFARHDLIDNRPELQETLKDEYGDYDIVLDFEGKLLK
jgi:hypothetical protein